MSWAHRPTRWTARRAAGGGTRRAGDGVPPGGEGSQSFTVWRGQSLRPTVEEGIRQVGGGADRCKGLDVGGGLVAAQGASGLSADVRLLAGDELGPRGFRERFQERWLSVRLGYDPTPSTPPGPRAQWCRLERQSPMSGAEARWSGGPLPQIEDVRDRRDRRAGTESACQWGAAWWGCRVSASGPRPLDESAGEATPSGCSTVEAMNFKVGVDAQWPQELVGGARVRASWSGHRAMAGVSAGRQQPRKPSCKDTSCRERPAQWVFLRHTHCAAKSPELGGSLPAFPRPHLWIRTWFPEVRFGQ